jgi:mannose-6-phosphate isomerase-like protein (cupin superfamily)
MAELKYQKYIVKDLTLPEEIQQKQPEYTKRATRIAWLDENLVEGAFSVICSWYWKVTEGIGTPLHTHDYDEVLGFFGGDPENPRDLYGEVEFWMDDEKYILNESCLIYIPKDLPHCPLNVLRVDKPIFFLAISLSGKYYKLFNT